MYISIIIPFENWTFWQLSCFSPFKNQPPKCPVFDCSEFRSQFYKTNYFNVHSDHDRTCFNFRFLRTCTTWSRPSATRAAPWPWSTPWPTTVTSSNWTTDFWKTFSSPPRMTPRMRELRNWRVIRLVCGHTTLDVGCFVLDHTLITVILRILDVHIF